MKIEDVFKRLKPIAGRDMDRVWLEYILADAKTQKVIEDALKVTLAQSLRQTYEEREILLEPPPERIARGEYPLGAVHYGQKRFHPFGMREEEWVRHLGIFGVTGSGKTNVSFLILLNFLRAGKPFLVFDWKRNYRDLAALPMARDILIFTVGRRVAPFYFNPLIPPRGTQPTVWLKKLIEIMCHTYFLGEGVAYLLQKAIDSAYRRFGVYEGNPDAYPTIRDVKEWLESHKVKGREGSWMESAIRTMGVLCYGEVDRVLNQRQPFPLEKLLERNAVLELDALTDSDKTFLIESLLLWIHHHRLAQEQRETFKHAIVIEEAHHILLRKKQEVTGEEAITDVILREIRELGEAIILIDQNPSLISKPALGNTYSTIAMNLKHRGDVKMIADCIMLDSAQARFLGKLEVGSAVVKLQGRWFEPFLVRFPLVNVNKGAVTDREVIRGMDSFYRSFSGLLRAPNAVPRASQEEREDDEPLRAHGKREKSEENNKVRQILTTEEKVMLNDVAQHPVSSVTERYSRLGVNAYQGNKLKGSLLLKSLIIVDSVSTGKGRIKILKISEKGRRALNSGDNHEPRGKREGGTEHEYWKERIAAHLSRKGYNVRLEKPIGGGKTTDVFAEKNGKRIAVEIETGRSDPMSNIRKDLDAGFDRVVSIALKEGLKDRIQAMLLSLTADEKEKVKVLDRVRLRKLPGGMPG